MAQQILHIYTRVSTQTQQDEGTSLDSQQELGIKKAKEMGFEYQVWNEGGASSKHEDFVNRPVLLELISEIDAGNVDHLWVYNNDRLSRNQITAQTIRIKLQKNAVTLYTNNGQFDLNNPQDNFLKTILDGVAQLDNAQRAERTRLGKLSRVRQGFWMGGPPPFGYEIKDKKLALQPEESKWVKQIYEWYNAGKSTEWIKCELDKSGVQTRRKKSLWSLGSLQKILQNTHPSGYYIYTDSKTDETIECTCPPIVSKTLWSTCQEKRKKTLARRGQNNRTKRFYLLRNFLYCGHCGSPMSGRIKEDKNEYLYYCPRKEREWVKSAPKEEDKWKRGKGCLMTRSLNIHATDNLVLEEVSKIIFDTKRLRERLRERSKKQQENLGNEDGATELQKLKNKQKRFTKELSNLIENIANVEAAKIMGKQDTRIADKILANLSSELHETDSQIEQCKVRIQELQSVTNIMENTRPVSYNLQRIEVPVKKQELQLHLKDTIDRIDVSYDKDKSEHELIIRFKLPLVDGKKDLTLNVKKNRKAA